MFHMKPRSSAQLVSIVIARQHLEPGLVRLVVCDTGPLLEAPSHSGVERSNLS